MHDPYRGEVPDSNSSDGKDHYYRTEKRKIEDKETGEEKIIKVKYCARSSCELPQGLTLRLLSSGCQGTPKESLV